MNANEIIIPIWIITAAISITGVLISYNALKRNADSDKRKEGEAGASVVSDIKYIKEILTSIKHSLETEIKRVEGRVDQLANTLSENYKETVKAVESAKSAHHRLDRIEGKVRKNET